MSNDTFAVFHFTIHHFNRAALCRAVTNHGTT
jgi:hypothetical protein